jgi:hypothetical protein
MTDGGKGGLAHSTMRIGVPHRNTRGRLYLDGVPALQFGVQTVGALSIAHRRAA